VPSTASYQMTSTAPIFAIARSAISNAFSVSASMIPARVPRTLRRGTWDGGSWTNRR